MNASSRHVRSLRVCAPDAAACRRGALALEDALHTATLPDTEGSRLYVVRRLAVGTIGARQSSGQVAETIKSRFVEICSQAVHAEADGARSRIAVWFRDASEPSLLLALRLARREATDAWFWPLAVPIWNPTLTRDEALRTLLHGVAEARTPPGPIAAVHFVAGLQAQGALAPLLEALTESDGTRLLHTFGWSLPSQIPGASASRTVGERSTESAGTEVRFASLAAPSVSGFSGEQATQVHKGLEDRLYVTMLKRWGVSDARSLWLSAMRLIASRPMRPLDSALPVDAQRMAQSVYSLLSLPSASTVSSSSMSSALSVLHDAQPASGASKRASASPPLSVSDAQQTDVAIKTDTKTGSEETESTPMFAPLSPESQKAREITAEEQGKAQESNAANPLKPVSDLKTEALSAQNDAVESGTARRSENVAQGAQKQVEPPSHSPLTSSLTSFGSFDVFADIPQPTEYAGLYFLIAVLARLGMGRLSEFVSPLLADDFPIRLLHHVGRGMGIAVEDPILTALPLPDYHADLRVESALWDTNVVLFSVPPAWRHELCDVRPLRHWRLTEDATAAEDTAWHVLTDGSGRLTLAIWRGETPSAAMRLLGEQPLPTVQAARTQRQIQSVETLLLDAWREALRRWCRRYAGMGLTAITRREGRVRVARTHIDIWLDLGQADIRIRRAGLDIDPGWVSWLGRVILFHYVGGG